MYISWLSKEKIQLDVYLIAAKSLLIEIFKEDNFLETSEVHGVLDKFPSINLRRRSR